MRQFFFHLNISKWSISLGLSFHFHIMKTNTHAHKTIELIFCFCSETKFIRWWHSSANAKIVIGGGYEMSYCEHLVLRLNKTWVVRGANHYLLWKFKYLNRILFFYVEFKIALFRYLKNFGNNHIQQNLSIWEQKEENLLNNSSISFQGLCESENEKKISQKNSFIH